MTSWPFLQVKGALGMNIISSITAGLAIILFSIHMPPTLAKGFGIFLR
uniref:Uncharacterized protein n=2 Tax=Anguilla anguilla TaxID=7936 RepID=A0A0E9RG16_ANGAN